MLSVLILERPRTYMYVIFRVYHVQVRQWLSGGFCVPARQHAYGFLSAFIMFLTWNDLPRQYSNIGCFTRNIYKDLVALHLNSN